MINTGYFSPDLAFVFLGGRLSLDFANTQRVDRGEKVDLLPDGASVLEWAQKAALISPTLRDTWLEARQPILLAELHHQAMGLRHTIGEVLQCAADADQASMAQRLPALNEFLALDGLHRHIHHQGDHFALDWQIDPGQATGILVRIALDAAGLIAEQKWRRIKQCQGPQCILHFYDTSKNASRRWCSMELCGNREKVTRHRRKQTSGH